MRLYSACPNGLFPTLPSLLHVGVHCQILLKWVRHKLGGSLYYFCEGLWYDPVCVRTHDLPHERRTRWPLIHHAAVIMLSYRESAPYKSIWMYSLLSVLSEEKTVITEDVSIAYKCHLEKAHIKTSYRRSPPKMWSYVDGMVHMTIDVIWRRRTRQIRSYREGKFSVSNSMTSRTIYENAYYTYGLYTLWLLHTSLFTLAAHNVTVARTKLLYDMYDITGVK